MNINRLIDNIVEDIGVDLLDQFDQNFERKGFFNQKWKPTTHVNNRGSLLLRTGKLRRSVLRSNNARQIRFNSSVPYAKLMNEGGVIVVTKKMKSFFWAKYHEAVGSTSKASNKQLEKLAHEALKWKRMAMMPIGKKMIIEQRQFIGWHPQVDRIIAQNAKQHIKILNKEIIKKLKQK